MGVLDDGTWTHDDSKFQMDPSKPGGVFVTPQDEVEASKHNFVL